MARFLLVLLLVACNGPDAAASDGTTGGASAPGEPPPGPVPANTPGATPGLSPAPLSLGVANLVLGATIPTAYTCEGADRSPAVRWGGAPPSTVSYALIVDDPDAPVGTWVHWLVWNIAGDQTGLIEAIRPGERHVVQGLNDFKQMGWGGPCPPPGNGAHRYYFRLYALNVELALPSGATRAQLDAAMAGHVVGTGEWQGRFERK